MVGEGGEGRRDGAILAGRKREQQYVPVVGGHAAITILPLLSQGAPPSSFTQDEIKYLTDRIQNGGTEVVEAKAGAGSATLSMAFAAAKFGDAFLRTMRGNDGIVECSYVASEVYLHEISISHTVRTWTLFLSAQGCTYFCFSISYEVTELSFFASQVRLGRGGAEEILPLVPLTDFDRAGLEAAKKELR